MVGNPGASPALFDALVRAAGGAEELRRRERWAALYEAVDSVSVDAALWRDFLEGLAVAEEGLGLAPSPLGIRGPGSLPRACIDGLAMGFPSTRSLPRPRASQGAGCACVPFSV